MQGGAANDKEAGAFQGPQAMAEMALMTVEGACQLLMVACDHPPEPISDRRPATGGAVSGAGISGLLPSCPSPRQIRRVDPAWPLRPEGGGCSPVDRHSTRHIAPLARWERAPSP